ncbi:hypothetical protein P3T73_04995 [Kiritimatiellota bacterium B12222]|nr:hypothetical protein P3T73_04995 [Kiritimatiellota bacterium B12222]
MSKKKPTEPMIACPSCGVPNRIALPFCKECGSRIYQGGKSPNQENTGKEVTPGGRAFRSAINSLLFVVVIAAVALAFWPYAKKSVPVGRDPGRQMEQYLLLADKAFSDGTTLPEARFSERNINAYIGQNNDENAGKLMGVILSAPNAQFIANEPVGPFNLSTRVMLKPKGEEGSLEVTDFWIGHLPLPTMLVKAWTYSLSERFDLNLDQELWNQLTLEQVKDSQLYVQFND